ncbi:hypothetical protein V1506DRAFT_575255 [Lipomyces tetrasporus]
MAKASPSSELAQACTIIVLANLGNRLRNAMHINRAESLYCLLLRSFRLSISNEAVFTTVESLLTAALLGLYEIITSTDACPDGHVAHAQGISAILVSKFSPFDLLFYVASLWNNYRKACLLVLKVIINCHRRINGYPSHLAIEALIQKDVATLTEGIVSSIPYLLTADLQAFVENAAAGSPPLVPGRPVGGLLSMHTLYVLSTLPMTERKLKVYTRDCLAWIGTRMGVGQAAILSKYTTMDQFQYATEARVIIWTGMLI